LTRIEVIAELSGNHMGKMNLAKKLIEKSKEAGVQFVKLQYYRTEELYTKDHPLFQKVKEAELSIEQISELKTFTEELGLKFVCTVFKNPKLVDDLEKIDLKYFKIRCADSHNYELIDRVLKVDNELVFISTRKLPLNPRYLYHPKIRWMYVNPTYPPKLEEFEVDKVAVFQGFSSHFPSIVPPLAAAVAAAHRNRKEFFIEVHVTLDHNMDVVDKAVSLDFNELKTLISYLKEVEQFSWSGAWFVSD